MAIALLTDFGSTDYYVGAIKGAILTIDPNASIVDITHDLRPHDIEAASFILAACFEDFPIGTVFMAVVDPGVGSTRRAVAVNIHGRSMVAPDNGLLSGVIGNSEYSAVELTNRRYFGPRESTTFHGRDIFAPVAAYVSLGVPLAELGPEINDLILISPKATKETDGSVTGRIIHIDRFGNLVTNIRVADAPAEPIAEINGIRTGGIRSSYSEMTAGELFLIEGSAGYLEVSCRESSAADVSSVIGGEAVRLLSVKPT